MERRKAELMTLRKFGVKQGRAMVRVRTIATGDLATAGMCPVCFNLKKRREALLIRLKKLGYEVVHRDDRLDGIYRPGKSHAPGCRFSHLSPDSWSEFKSAIKRLK